MDTFYTKCGRIFTKTSKSVTTGYRMSDDDAECLACPHRMDVTKGWPGVHDYWVCRAGSKPPNQETEPVDTGLGCHTSLYIHTLDLDMIDLVKTFGQTLPGFGGIQYLSDSQADCRRTISVSFLPNKMGNAAREAILREFFPDLMSERYPLPVPAGAEKTTGETEMLEESLKCRYILQNRNSRRPNVASCLGFCAHNDGCSVLICTGKAKESVLTMIPEGECPVADEHRGISDPAMKTKLCVDCEHCEPSGHGKGHPLQHKCINAAHRVGLDFYFDGDDITACKNFEPGRKLPTAQEPVDLIQFDYTTVDTDTAVFLQEAAQRIAGIRIRSMLEVGKELAAAHERLANHKTGTFGVWVESLGMSRRTAEMFLQTNEYIAKKFRNIDDADAIQPSLLMAMSRPSAPPALQEQVMNGEISTITEWKERMREMAGRNEDLQKLSQRLQHDKIQAERQASDLKTQLEIERTKPVRNNEILERDLTRMKAERDGLLRNASSTRVLELEAELNQKAQELSRVRAAQQATPIEATISRSVEVDEKTHDRLVAEKYRILMEPLADMDMRDTVRIARHINDCEDWIRDDWFTVLDAISMNITSMGERCEKEKNQ